MKRIPFYCYMLLLNGGIIGLVGLTVYWLHDAWPLLGLIFLSGWRTSNINTECPVCHHGFVAVRKDDDS